MSERTRTVGRDPLDAPQGFGADSNPPYGEDRGPDVEPRWMRCLDWIEAHTPGDRWPWGQVWLGPGILRGFAFHFASGAPTGFALTFPLPRWLPGFVKPYQVDELRTRAGRRNSDLHATLPLFPPGRPTAMRTLRLRGRYT